MVVADVEHGAFSAIWGNNSDSDMAMPEITREQALAIAVRMVGNLKGRLRAGQRIHLARYINQKKGVFRCARLGYKSMPMGSGTFSCGSKAQGWVHLAGTSKERTILTEGPMKADVINALTGCTVLAVPGVNALAKLEEALSRLRQAGLREVKTAFDYGQ